VYLKIFGVAYVSKVQGFLPSWKVVLHNLSSSNEMDMELNGGYFVKVD
jgi:hypothetical protein